MTYITFIVIFEQKAIEITTFSGEYFNLMQLINDKIYIEDFGACKGMGRCGTCLVVLNEETLISASDRNESNTINKLGLKNSLIRLSCQIEIDKQLNNSIIKVIDQ